MDIETILEESLVQECFILGNDSGYPPSPERETLRYQQRIKRDPEFIALAEKKVGPPNRFIG